MVYVTLWPFHFLHNKMMCLFFWLSMGQANLSVKIIGPSSQMVILSSDTGWEEFSTKYGICGPSLHLS